MESPPRPIGVTGTIAGMVVPRNIYTTDELQAIFDQTTTFVANEVKPHGDQWEIDGAVPRQVLLEMGKLGMFGLRVPVELGGLGLGPLASATFAEALASSTYGGFDATVLVHTDMASPHLINAGTDEQLDRYLTGILSGEIITAVGVTEPDAGSDVAGMRTRAERDGDGWRLNGAKMFITNGVHGNLVMVAARTNPDDRYGISMFLVEHGTEGFSVANKLDKTGWRSSDTAELVLDDVWLPGDCLLGEEHRGFYEVMKNFQNERLVIAAMVVGSAQAAIDITLAYTQDRKAFGQTLFDLGAIRQRMGMNQAKLDAVRASMYHAAWLMEQGVDATKEISGLKAFGAETAIQIAYDCVQFHGGMGYMRESAVERISRDMRINTIGGGATEVMLEEVAKRSYATRDR